MSRVRALARKVYGPPESWRHILIDAGVWATVIAAAYGALVAWFDMPETGATRIVVVGALIVFGVEMLVSYARWRRRHRAHMLDLTCAAIRRKAQLDAEAGRLLGTLDGVHNWLRLREVPEDQVEDLINIYVETYDETTGLEGMR